MQNPEQLMQIAVIVILVIIILYLSCRGRRNYSSLSSRSPLLRTRVQSQCGPYVSNEGFSYEEYLTEEEGTEMIEVEVEEEDEIEQFAECEPIINGNTIEGFVCNENFATLRKPAPKNSAVRKTVVRRPAKKVAAKVVAKTVAKTTPTTTSVAKEQPQFKVTGESLQLINGSGVIVDKICFGDQSKCIDSSMIDSIVVTTKNAPRVNSYLNYANTLSNYMYSPNPADSMVYQNVLDAWDNGVIQKIGDTNIDDKTYRTKPWNGYPILSIGTNDDPDNKGVAVKVPAGMTVLWVRVLNERWNVFRAADITDPAKPIELGRFGTGFRKLNRISPDGGPNDGSWNFHVWMPIPLIRTGPCLIQLTSKPNTDYQPWLSGIAFSTNPWNHATNSAIAYFQAINGGTPVKWNTQDWNNDQLAILSSGAISSIMVPVVPSGKDKLLYIVEHNSNWDGVGVTGISVNGVPIERFKTTYDNPFARHHNTKAYQKYVAARIPAALIDPNSRFVSVTIDMTRQNNSLNFREIGTHDIAIF